ncbi:MAG: hypothetical protein P4L53_11575 [Candidatus Obscuribacterales bacterium]|nr:hypothetical protein [Candidatus Obscuribacterales bacterium]
MVDNADETEHDDDSQTLLHRRTLLKVMASAPLVVSLGLFSSPVMRFLKPTMKAGNFFQSADLPTADKPPLFNLRDLADVWTCIPFMMPMKYLVFNPEQYEVRKIPGFVIRTGKNQIVAFSRICPKHRDHVLNFVLPAADGSCGCVDKSCKGYCIGYAKTPSLICSYDKSVFDIGNNGRASCGAARYSARQFSISRNGDWISIDGFEQVGIA